jgi:hypothetical protein
MNNVLGLENELETHRKYNNLLYTGLSLAFAKRRGVTPVKQHKNYTMISSSADPAFIVAGTSKSG